MSEQAGLYGKYRITKADGAPLDGPSFVLRYDRDPHARAALSAYASSIWNENRELSYDLNREVLKWTPHLDGTIDGLVEIIGSTDPDSAKEGE